VHVIFEPIAAAFAVQAGFDSQTSQLLYVATVAAGMVPLER
jgi:hypothetical protein